MHNFKTLSNAELELNLKKFVASERKILHVILEHIVEIDLRKIYLAKAYSSLFEYLVKEYGYSASAAMRRIEAVKLMQVIPDLSAEITGGRINLTQVGELSRAVKEKEREAQVPVSVAQKKKLLSLIAGKSTSETQKDLAWALNIELAPAESKRVQKDDSVHLQITLTADQYRKIMACRDLSASALSEAQDHSTSRLIEILADSYLQKRALSCLSSQTQNQKNLVNVENNNLANQKQKNLTNPDQEKLISLNNENLIPTKYKNLLRQKKKDLVSGEDMNLINHEQKNVFQQKHINLPKQTNIVSYETKINLKEKHKVITAPVLVRDNNRSLTLKTRSAILKRDRCCQFKDASTGRICCSTYDLEIDHRTSRWAGGNHAANNLQVLCRAYNKYKYQLETGVRILR